MLRPVTAEIARPFADTAPELVSVVIPFLDEADTLDTLCAQLAQVFADIDRAYEIILVDDGSRDGSTEIARQLATDADEINAVLLRRNFGKAAALSAGFAAAQGKWIITMDADLQDDPTEIPRFLEALEAGNDVVSGWKKKRHDPIGKTLPSKVFNGLTCRAFGIDLHDINCGFKGYTRDAVQHLNLYGELHRFTPAILHAAGFRVTELAVEHHPRRHGQSKYGWSRFAKGLLDLTTVMMMTRYGRRPLHFFALLGLPLLLLGGLFISYLSALWLAGMGPIGDRPLLLFGVLFVMAGIQLLGTGLIAEMVMGPRLREGDKYLTRETVT